jgi:hypothetical protein
MKLTVYFNNQYWVGIVESYVDGYLKVGRSVFGSEPQDAEVLEFIKTNEIIKSLDQSTSKTKEFLPDLKRINPKRMARQVSKELNNYGISTKAQDVIKQEMESKKKESKKRSKLEKDLKEEERWIRSREKAKLKHRGKA